MPVLPRHDEQVGVDQKQVGLEQTSVQAGFDISLICDSTDTGVAQVVLKNFRRAPLKCVFEKLI